MKYEANEQQSPEDNVKSDALEEIKSDGKPNFKQLE